MIGARFLAKKWEKDKKSNAFSRCRRITPSPESRMKFFAKRQEPRAILGKIDSRQSFFKTERARFSMPKNSTKPRMKFFAKLFSKKAGK